MAITKAQALDLRLRFNDAMMRELGFDLTDEGYLFDMNTESVLQIKEKYIKYCEVDNPYLKHDEIEMNLLENSRLAETLVIPFLSNYCNRIGVVFQSIAQVPIPGANKGMFVMYYNINGETKSMVSDPYISESVRVFNFITKLNKTSHLYQFDIFDITLPRKK
jgi:hypothetical protein